MPDDDGALPMRVPGNVRTVLAGASVLAILLMPMPARAAGTWYVATGPILNPPADMPERCATPDAATLQDGVDKAVAGDSIYLCPGTHEVSGTVALRAPAGGDPAPSLTIQGYSASRSVVTAPAGQGVEPVGLIDTRGWDVTFQDLSLVGGSALAGPGAVWGTSIVLSRVSVLDNHGALGAVAAGTVDVRGSTFDSNVSDGDGGAINAAVVTISTSSFTSNRAENGGAIAAGAATLTGARFANNSARLKGGAVTFSIGLEVADSRFTRNDAARGGAIYFGAGDAFLTNVRVTSSTFEDNDAILGGAYMNGSTLKAFPEPTVFTGVTFRRNNATVSGGALFAASCQNPGDSYGAVTRVVGSRFEANTADMGGAIAGGFFLVEDSVLVDNVATTAGGAIFGDPACFPQGGDDDFTAWMAVIESTLETNRAPSGGAIAVTDPVLYTRNATFTGNVADSGGAIRVDSNAYITFSTFIGNVAASGGVFSGSGARVGASILQSDAQVRACADGFVLGDLGGILATDPSCDFPTQPAASHVVAEADLALEPLALNGGVVPSAALRPASVATNASTCSWSIQALWPTSPFPLTHALSDSGLSLADARGRERPAGVGCDSGAYERTDPATLFVGSGGRPDLGGGCPQPDVTSPSDAIDRTIAGDTVHVCAGTYPLSGPLTPSSRVTIEGDGAGRTILDGQATHPIIEAFGDSDVTLADLTLRNGSGGLSGGAVFATTVKATRVSFEGNSSPFVGGAVVAETAVVRDSSFSGNESRIGGALYAGTRADIANTTFAGNRATSSAGAVSAATGTITHATLVDNEAPAGGKALEGGIAVLNSVVGDPSRTGLCGTAVMDGGGNRTTDASCVGGATDSALVAWPDLRLGSFGDNGGPTATIPLLPGSPAIDAGRTSICLASSVGAHDQRGVLRPQGGGCDAGAFEVEDAACAAGPSAGDIRLGEDAGILEDHPFVIDGADVLAASTCFGGAVLTVDAAPAGWAVAVGDAYDLTVTPRADDQGTFEIGFRLAGAAGSATAHLTVLVAPVNDAPQATAPPSASVAADGAVTISFEPAPDAAGVVDLTVIVQDDGGTANGGEDTAGPLFVRLTIDAVDDPPIAAADAYALDEGGRLDVPAPGILGNDRDVDDAALTAAVVTPPRHGSLELASDGSFRYVPERGFAGTDGFVYSAADRSSVSRAGVELTVRAIAGSPTPAPSPTPTQAPSPTPAPSRAPSRTADPTRPPDQRTAEPTAEPEASRSPSPAPDESSPPPSDAASASASASAGVGRPGDPGASPTGRDPAAASPSAPPAGGDPDPGGSQAASRAEGPLAAVLAILTLAGIGAVGTALWLKGRRAA